LRSTQGTAPAFAAYVDFSAVRESLKQQFRAALHRSRNNDQTKHKKIARLLTALGPSLSELQIHKRLKMSRLLRASRQFGTACIGREPRMLFSPGRETSPWTLMKRYFAFGGKAWVGGSENSPFDWMGKKPKKLYELRSPHANGPALRRSNKKGADLAIHPLPFCEQLLLSRLWSVKPLR
jgi:hypothetical protein